MNNKRYKNLISSEQETCSNIMKKIDMPSSVFKYRCFCRNMGNGIEEDPYWRESMDGIVFYSLAKDFHRNDSEDCKLKYNKNAVRDALCRHLGYKGKRNHQFVNFIDDKMQDYIVSIRDNFRIGCFTISSPEERYMWDNEHFGGNHTGYCIEYCTSKEIMFPGTIIFLPVLYDADRYDSTKVIKNLIENGGDANSLNVISLAYNFALIKYKTYIQEKEWRIIVTNNRYNEYFKVGEGKIDLSNTMKAIYLGKDYNKYDSDGKKYEFALDICKSKNIPLYKMIDVEGKLVKRCIYKSL